MANPSTTRIFREITNAQKNPDLSIAVAYRDSDVRHVRALICGPPDTPYQYGFFEFMLKFPKDYPIKAPHVRAVTTNGGRTRFNPNIYAEGKVCLSILGTWRGESGEEWSSAQGLDSVLLSIQSLMSPNPYENEPGFDHTKKEDKRAIAYAAKIRHETLRIAVLERLEGLLQLNEDDLEPVYKKVRRDVATMQSADGSPPSDDASTPTTDPVAYEYDAEAIFHSLESSTWDPFGDLIKRRFLWYYDAYVHSIEDHGSTAVDGKTFERAEFEFSHNEMAGAFDYKGLRRRFDKVMEALISETTEWEQKGVQQVERSTQLATQLAFQFKQLGAKWNEQQYAGPRMEISLPNPQNPFVWHLTFFGGAVTNLDGGVWNMKLYIPSNFPEAQPRVVFETPIFHHRVSSRGTLCYFPEKPDEIESHLKAIVASIADEKSSYDPRAMVNPETFELYWGGEDKRKVYNRKLRRSAQESMDFA